ncbi:hypothetical protein [Indioceanicola profundi]|uniref:hypothetical protein n=1 Tax=Indioceanicola profundi TaxID=2220096 RepID=UPI000E6AAB7F|nr:hypothetical protein [Indioceanicola profundi]
MTYQTEAPDYRSAYRDFDYEDDHDDRDWDDRIEDTIKDNKLPLALIGLGIGWMLLSSARETEMYQQYSHQMSDRTRGLRQRARSTFDDYRNRAESAVGRSSGDKGSGSSTDAGYDRIADYDARQDYASNSGSGSSWRSGMSERYGHVTDRARGMGRNTSMRARQVGRSFWDMVDEHPLAVGLMGVALGAAMGASLPATETEDEWLGDYRDRTMDQLWSRGQETARQATDVAKEAVSAGAHAARETAERRAEEQGLTGNGGNGSTSSTGNGSTGSSNKS